ncbi:hypothetical protein BCEP4_220214 [Burkholderia cepacia]|nr:hypothetical protein BCEP4_220214 [Burkholderia cepacia]
MAMLRQPGIESSVPRFGTVRFVGAARDLPAVRHAATADLDRAGPPHRARQRLLTTLERSNPEVVIGAANMADYSPVRSNGVRPRILSDCLQNQWLREAFHETHRCHRLYRRRFHHVGIVRVRAEFGYVVRPRRYGDPLSDQCRS